MHLVGEFNGWIAEEMTPTADISKYRYLIKHLCPGQYKYLYFIGKSFIR